MKRGLKEYSKSHLQQQRQRYNRFPDEKGTERHIITLHGTSGEIVTTVSPMKRGLKAKHIDKVKGVPCVTTVSPMKRGLKARTERATSGTDKRYNRFPDEKGTESRPSKSPH